MAETKANKPKPTGKEKAGEPKTVAEAKNAKKSPVIGT